ncbi:MAG: cadherin-like domain-containing protein, partial [Rhodospirillales bacterium]
MKKQIKILYTIAIYILSLAHVSAQELVPSKTTYKPGEDIVLTFSDGPGNAKDWVGIYKEGQTPGVVASTLWFYVDGTDGGSTGKATGSLVFKGSLSVGWYEAHLLEGDNYNILASTSFEVSEKTSLPEGVYFEEDFDGLTLGAFESDSESGGDGTDWTAQGPPGWTMGKGEGHGSTAGGEAVKEFDGWTFMDPVSWDATAGQERAQFKKGQGVIAVADSDEYDDKADAKFDAWLSTPEIDITGAGAGTLVLSYDSSWRQEPQTGRVTVSYDGGEEVTLLELGADTATAYDETVELDLKNPAGAKTAVISWDHQGHNNWWWAIDNIMVTGDTGSGVGGPDGLSSILSGLSDEALDSLIAHYDGKHGVKTEGNSVVSWTPINSNGSFLDSMIVRSTQKGGGAPELITYDGSGKLTFDDTNVVADGRYLEGALSNAESKEFTVFWVGNYSADSPFATSGTYVYNIGINSTSHQRDDGKGRFVVEQYNGTTYPGDDITAYDGVSTVWSTVLTADSHAFYANGTNLNVGGTPSNNVKANVSIIIGAYSSSGYDFVGDVEQLIIFGSALSDADRELIEDYYGEEKDNAAPVVADQSVDVNEDGSVSITLSGSDEEEDTLSFTVLSQPKNGTLSGTAPSLSYSPNANYSGSDIFSYKANDGSADSNTAIVTITVNGVNDKPEVANQSVDVDEDGSVSITLNGSDEEGDTLSFTVLSQPKN